MKTKAQLIDYYDEVAGMVIDFKNSHVRNYDWHNIICVNVKLGYSKKGYVPDEDDFLKIIDKVEEEDSLGMTADERERIIEKFDEEHLYNMWNWWLDDQREMVTGNYITGEGMAEPGYWQKVIDHYKATGITEYQSSRKDKNGKHLKASLSDLKRYKRDHDKLWNALYEICNSYDRVNNMFKFEHAGFYGRSGGWFGINRFENDWQEEFYTGDYLALVDDLTVGSITVKEANERFKELIGNVNIPKRIAAYEYILGEVERMAEGLDFTYEVQFRIEEYLGELREEMVPIAQL